MPTLQQRISLLERKLGLNEVSDKSLFEKVRNYMRYKKIFFYASIRGTEYPSYYGLDKEDNDYGKRFNFKQPTENERISFAEKCLKQKGYGWLLKYGEIKIKHNPTFPYFNYGGHFQAYKKYYNFKGHEKSVLHSNAIFILWLGTNSKVSDYKKWEKATYEELIKQCLDLGINYKSKEALELCIDIANDLSEDYLDLRLKSCNVFEERILELEKFFRLFKD